MSCSLSLSRVANCQQQVHVPKHALGALLEACDLPYVLKNRQVHTLAIHTARNSITQSGHSKHGDGSAPHIVQQVSCGQCGPSNTYAGLEREEIIPCGLFSYDRSSVVGKILHCLKNRKCQKGKGR